MSSPSSTSAASCAPLGAGPRLAVIAGTLALGAVWLAWTGPHAVVRVVTPLPEQVPFAYMESAFLILGMLVADLLEKLRGGLARPAPWVLAGQIALVIVLSALRLEVRAPLSGHAVLVSFFLAYRFLGARDARHPLDRIEILVAAFFLLGIAFVKLMHWRDPVTLVVGVLLGAVVAGLGALMEPKPRAAPRSP